MKGKIYKNGTKTNVFSVHLCNRIRKRLGLTQKQLPNKVIHKTIKFINKKMGEWIMENPEGLQVFIGNNPFGVLAVSKHMPKELREDKFSKHEEIESLDVPPYRKKNTS